MLALLLRSQNTPLIAGAAVIILLLLLVIAALLLRKGRDARFADEAAFREAEAKRDMSDILRSQAEMQGRLATMAEIFSRRQSEFNQSINQRLDGMTQRVSATLNEQTKSTHDNLRRLQERLAIIDTAQNNIQTLAKDVVGLQAILSNKQTRGAFGQARMEAIIADGLPLNAYTFQQTLSNGTRPDCIIRMPNAAPPLVIDAKFPLEAWNAIRAAEQPEQAKQAGQQFRRDLETHIKDISEKYLLSGETQDTAFLFVPSESIFAEIHENFDAIVQKAQRARVVIVSPSLLMLSIQVIQSVLKDQRMREQAHLIQGEVIRLMEDVGRLGDRVGKLQSHFAAAQRDVEMIVTSAEKIGARGQKIEAMEFSLPVTGAKEPAAIEEKQQGALKLRLVDED